MAFRLWAKLEPRAMRLSMPGTAVCLRDGRRACPRQRLRLARALEHAQVDAVVAASPANVAYLADCECLMHPLVGSLRALVVSPAGEEPDPVLISPSIGLDEWAERRPWFDEIRLYGPPNRDFGRALRGDPAGLSSEGRAILEQGLEKEHPAELVPVLAGALRDRGLDRSRIAIDQNGLTQALREQIAASVPGCQLVEGSALLGWVRMVKTEPEIAALADAALMACEALDEARDVAVAGSTEQDVWRAYCAAVARRGGEFTFMTVGAGTRSALIHPTASDCVLRKGDVVKYDVGLRFRRYHADTGRTQALGTVSKDCERAYEAVQRGHAAALDAVGPASIQLRSSTPLSRRFASTGSPATGVTTSGTGSVSRCTTRRC